MEFFLRFLIISCIWSFLDEILKKPLSKLFSTDEGSASCTIAVVLGALLGYFYMPIIAFSFEQKTSSWTASICLIISSFIFHGVQTGSLNFY